MIKELKFPFLYIIAVLAVSWAFAAIIFSNPDYVGLYGIVMYFPALTAIIIGLIQYKSLKVLFRSVFHKVNIKSVLFSILYPLGFILILALIAHVTGLAEFNPDKLSNLKQIPTLAGLLIGISLMFGEEFGWRGYLLKEIANKKNKITAAFIVGIVWALWHAPIVYGLAVYHQMDYPFLIMLAQMCVVFVFSIPFAYSFFLTKNIIPAMIFHFVWNFYNPIILGNIYQNYLGIMEGRLLLINGEGLMGLILGLIAMVWFIRIFKRY